MKNIIIKKSILFLMLLTTSSLFAHFGSKGPYGGGTVTCAVTKADSVFIGTANGGVYLSTKLGNWSTRSVGLKSGKIVAITHTGKFAIAATVDSGLFRFSGFVGTDRYWQKINNGLTDFDFSSVLAINESTVLAGTTNGQIFRSLNGGDVWGEVLNLPFAGQKITTIVNAVDRIYVLTESKGIFYSDDNASTWKSMNDVNTADKIAGQTLSYNQNTNELMLQNSAGIFILANASTTLTPTYQLVSNNPSSVTVNSISNNGQNWYIATDKSILSSPTSSISWTEINSGLPNASINVVAFYLTNLIAGTVDEGIYKTDANTIAWVTANTGFNNLVTYSFASNATKLIYVATEKGVFVTKDLATTYQRANNGLTDSLHVNDLVIFGSKVFAATENAGVFVSADSGKVWSPFVNGLDAITFTKLFASDKFIYAFDGAGKIYQYKDGFGWVNIQGGLPTTLDPIDMTFISGKAVLATHGQGVFWKDELAGDWVDINGNITTDHLTSVTALGTTIYVGTHGGGVLKTDIRTIDWKTTAETSIDHTVLMGLDGSDIQAMGTYGGYVFASYKGGLLATADEGKTWERGGNQFNLPSFTDVNKINFAGERVFVTTENNCIYSNALSELPLNVTFSKIQYATCEEKNGELSIAFTGGTAFTAPAAPYKIKWSTGDTTSLTLTGLSAGDYWVEITDKNGLISKDSISLTKNGCLGVDENSIAEILSIYPNPTNGQINISTSLEIRSLILFNQFGQEVYRNENTESAIKQLDIDVNPGIYILKLFTTNKVYEQKIVIE